MMKIILTIMQIILCALIILLGFKNKDYVNIGIGVCLIILSIL
jgi:hypothetical protein